MESINHAYITVVFSTSDHLPALLTLADKTPQVKLLVSIDGMSPEVKNALEQWGGKIGIKVMELSERTSHISESEVLWMTRSLVEAFGKANPIDPIPATPDLVSSICYTSVCFGACYGLTHYSCWLQQGTTGNPKGNIYIFDQLRDFNAC
jgi:long-chain acyl-CoA synthetase